MTLERELWSRVQILEPVPMPAASPRTQCARDEAAPKAAVCPARGQALRTLRHPGPPEHRDTRAGRTPAQDGGRREDDTGPRGAGRDLGSQHVAVPTSRRGSTSVWEPGLGPELHALSSCASADKDQLSGPHTAPAGEAAVGTGLLPGPEAPGPDPLWPRRPRQASQGLTMSALCFWTPRSSSACDS